MSKCFYILLDRIVINIYYQNKCRIIKSLWYLGVQGNMTLLKSGQQFLKMSMLFPQSFGSLSGDGRRMQNFSGITRHSYHFLDYMVQLSGNSQKQCKAQRKSHLVKLEIYFQCSLLHQNIVGWTYKSHFFKIKPDIASHIYILSTSEAGAGRLSLTQVYSGLPFLSHTE